MSGEANDASKNSIKSDVEYKARMKIKERLDQACEAYAAYFARLVAWPALP